MKEKTLQGIVGIDRKIPFFEKLIYSSTNGVGTFYFMMIQIWLLFYYTDILKISPAFVGVMFIAVRTFDAIITPVFGVFVDRQNTRWGKYRPWMLFTGFLLAISGFLTFLPVNFGQVGDTIYAAVTYFVFSTCISCGNAPGAGMSAAISKRQDDRMMISIIGFVWILVLSVVAQVGSQPIINALGHGDQGAGFRGLMLGAMILFCVWYLLVVKVSKERFTLQSEKQESLSIKSVFHNLFNNQYALITIGFIFALNLFNGVRSSVGIYYYKYYFNDANMLALIGGITILPTLLGSFLSPVITRKFSLRINLVSAVSVNMITSLLMYFLPATDTGKTEFIVLSVIGGLFVGIAQPAQGTMMPAAIDYGEWKHNTNSGGFFGALSGFIQTLATAISGGSVALVLSVSKYVPDVQQTVSALNGIKFMMSILPGVFFLIGLVILSWDMSEAKHKEIVADLNGRREVTTSKPTGDVSANI